MFHNSWGELGEVGGLAQWASISSLFSKTISLYARKKKE
jgi:hypothetical protein